MVMKVSVDLLGKTVKEFVRLTRGSRFWNSTSPPNKMEGVIKTISGKMRPAASPISSSPGKRLAFTGISPLKSLEGVKTPTDRPFRVSIEGNIGAGKSTLIKYFENIEGIQTFPEPLEWWRNLNGENLLDLMYSDIHKWLNVFQSYVQLTRVQIQTSRPSSTNVKVHMFERSVQNNRFCFMEQAYRNGYLHGADYSILDQWYRFVRANMDISVDLIVYLRTSPETVYKRMMARGRPEEASVSLEYLQQLHESHERWLMSGDERFNTVPVLVLDANKGLDEILEDYKKNENRILGFEKRGIKRVDKSERARVKKALKMDEA